VISIAGTVRADNGCGYLGFTTEAGCTHPKVTVHLAEDTAAVLPTCLIELDLPASKAALLPADADSHAWAVLFPLMQKDISIDIEDGEGGHAETGFSVLRSKIDSRLLTRRNPALAAALRHAEDTCWTGRTRLLVNGVWPAGNETVLRWQAIYATDSADAAPWLSAMDTQGNDFPLSPIVMEDHLVPAERDQLLCERIVTFSCRVPADVPDLIFRTGLAGAEGTEGFSVLLASEERRLLDETRARIAGASGDPAYEHWLDCHRSSWRDLELERAVSKKKHDELPSMTGILHISAEDIQKRPEQVRRAVRSLQQQTLSGLECIVAGTAEALAAAKDLVPADEGFVMQEIPAGPEGIRAAAEKASGSYLLLLDADVFLEPDACWRLAEAVAEAQKQGKEPPALLYADSDELADGHFCNPSFKTFPNLGKLTSMDYFGPVVAVRRDVPELVGWPSPLCGELLYDLDLRVMEQGLPAFHVSKVLSHRQGQNTGDWTGRKRALEDHFKRARIAASVLDGPCPGTFRIRYALPEPAPLISIIIPSKNHRSLLSKCVSSILDKSSYKNFEIVIVENNSTEPATFELYEKLKETDSRICIETWKPEGKTEGGFNYSAIVNAGARAAKGEYLLFLNNDTEVIAADWLEELLGCFMRKEVGAAGAKLLFEDGLIQHAGMTANPNCDNAHFNQNLAADAWGYECSAALPSDMNMVTGACQMTRRDIFEQLGGYDEELAVGFNDSDYCLRVREAGYAVAFTPYALLHHREFSSRGREAADIRLKSRLLQEKAYMIAKHPAFYAQGDETINENLDRFSNYFSLRW
jgi:O-antigen biosynthesis protein